MFTSAVRSKEKGTRAGLPGESLVLRCRQRVQPYWISDTSEENCFFLSTQTARFIPCCKQKSELGNMISLSLVAVPLVVSYLVYKYLVFPVFLSPLSKIPSAHFSSSFSPVWILWKRYKAQENRTIHAAHVKCGNIVRLGPNEVSVACVDDGIRTVYSGGFEKWSWYPNQFENYG